MKMPITKAGSEKLYGIGNNSDKYIITPNSIHLLEGRIYLFKDKDILKWLNFFMINTKRDLKKENNLEKASYNIRVVVLEYCLDILFSQKYKE